MDNIVWMQYSILWVRDREVIVACLANYHVGFDLHHWMWYRAEFV